MRTKEVALLPCYKFIHFTMQPQELLRMLLQGAVQEISPSKQRFHCFLQKVRVRNLVHQSGWFRDPSRLLLSKRWILNMLLAMKWNKYFMAGVQQHLLPPGQILYHQFYTRAPNVLNLATSCPWRHSTLQPFLDSLFFGLLTPVAGRILRTEIWKPKSAQFGTLSILPNLKFQFTCFCVSSFQDLFVSRWVRKSPQGFFLAGSDAFPAASSARAFGATAQREKAPRHCVQVKRSLISIFWKSRVYLEYSIATDNIGRIELALSSLQALSCRYCRLQLSTPSKLVISKKWSKSCRADLVEIAAM